MDSHEVTITPYRDGPLLVRGPFRLQDVQGNEIPTDRQVVALCRCGKSRIRPLCDGSHKLSSFRAPSGPERRPRRTKPGAAKLASAAPSPE
jgi:CDGSH-type Zn-finger protein